MTVSGIYQTSYQTAYCLTCILFVMDCTCSLTAKSNQTKTSTCRTKYQPPNFRISLWREPTHKYIFFLTRPGFDRYLTGCITCVSCFRLSRSFDCSAVPSVGEFKFCSMKRQFKEYQSTSTTPMI